MGRTIYFEKSGLTKYWKVSGSEVNAGKAKGASGVWPQLLFPYFEVLQSFSPISHLMLGGEKMYF